MRRAVARGRVYPQSFSTDRRYGRLSVKAVALFPLIWVNADDQGRLCGDPEEVKYLCCPNIDHITKTEMPNILKDLEDNQLIKIYGTPQSRVIQVLDWWDAHRAPQWAWPSEYPPLNGWQDHLRYKKGATNVVTLNWPLTREDSGDISTPDSLASPQTPLLKETDTGEGIRRGRGRGRGNSPEHSGENTKGFQVSLNNHSGEKAPSPSPASLPNYTKLEQDIYQKFIECMPFCFKRQPDSRELAQIRDYSKEVAAAGAAPQMVFDAFKEAGNQNKLHLSYVHAILIAWLDATHTKHGKEARKNESSMGL